MEFAQSFVTDTGTTFTMLWNDSFEAWRHYSVFTSSDFLLLDATGNRSGEGPVPFDRALVEELLADLA